MEQIFTGPDYLNKMNVAKRMLTEPDSVKWMEQTLSAHKWDIHDCTRVSKMNKENDKCRQWLEQIITTCLSKINRAKW